MRGRTNQRGERSPHDLPFHAADPDKRVRHGGSARVEAVRRVRRGGVCAEAFVETASERARVRRRRTHARPLLLLMSLTALLLHQLTTA